MHTFFPFRWRRGDPAGKINIARYFMFYLQYVSTFFNVAVASLMKIVFGRKKKL